VLRYVPTNFLRHYYDIYQLLDVETVQQFIGTPEYLAHKKKRFKSLDQNVATSGAFTIEHDNIHKQFETEYAHARACAVAREPHDALAAHRLQVIDLSHLRAT